MSGVISCTGFFSTLRFLQAKSADELERAVGFEMGRLAPGFTLAVLAEDETLKPDEFSLKASSRWSAGLVRPSTSDHGKDIADLLIERGQDVEQLKLRVANFFARRGVNTPAKILPNLRHTAGMRYPDAEALGPGISAGIPQFELLKRKRFVVLQKLP